MADDGRTKTIPRRTPESAEMTANVRRAMAITAAINRLTFNDADEVRALFSDLIGGKVDDSFLLAPPFYATGGLDTRVGRNVFINQNCTFYDLGGIDIADDVMIGPNVSIITSGHPIEPSRRRAAVTARPIAIGRNVWIAAGVTIIGGVTIPHSHGLLGHSDADVLLHAITDALLGAAGLGDIGRHFPDTDPAFKGADSRVLLREAMARVRQAGWTPVNIDATLHAQAPKIGPHAPAMVRNIAADTGLAETEVNIKAKTNEGLGYLGRKEGIAATVVTLLART